ncbi:MAG: DUF87 domain-containing protein, partial [Campylobacterota bacterium]|nr:DUF87 domain-containing protein [Campylobacterota bacterium]
KSTQDQSLTLLKNKNLTTHAAIIGMTGSGKTGLGMGLIEEAMLDNIPSILIDPKGDMGNLCMRSPSYEAKDFVPWVGEEKSAPTANMWKEGIESWDQDISRSQKLSETPVTIYTPGSSAGVSVNILSSLDAPGEAILDDSDLFSAYLGSTASSLLSLIGEESDIHSKTYTLLTTLIAHAWRNDVHLNLETLIASIIKPSFEKIGFLALDDFYPSNERFKLASRFNSVFANPSFSQWLQGVELDIDKLLFDENAKAKVSIFSIAHLSDSERMFFVTMLLNRYIAWMRRQSGTSALRTLLYMDEIYGYFPPSKNPPSKAPMMLLLKQARAFGVGVILSTQNPVDLDYKGLSNIGTWFIGRLQTRQDIDKVIEGLSGKLGSGLSKEEIRSQLSNMKKRTFFLKSAHREDIEIFQTRWVLSYLKGPLKRDEIKALMHAQKTVREKTTSQAEPKKQATTKSKNTYSGELPQYFDVLGSKELTPSLLINAEIFYHNQSKGINETNAIIYEVALDEDDIDLSQAQESESHYTRLATKAPKDATYAPLPTEILQRQAEKKIHSKIQTYLYQSMNLQMYRVRSPRLESKPKESLQAFSVRFQDLLNQKRDAKLTLLEARYAKKEQRIAARIEKAHARLEKEESDVSAKTTDTLVSAGLAIFGTFFGSRSRSKISSTISKGARISKEKADVRRIESDIASFQKQYQELQDELEDKIDLLDSDFDLKNYTIEPFQIRPKKRDITIKDMALIWRSITPYM